MKLCLRFLLILSLISANGLTYAQSHQVVRITEAGARGTAEVSVAINPKNPENLVAASFQSGQAGGVRVSNVTYHTTDGGKTWKTMPTQNPKSLVQGDDAVTFNSEGIVYHSFISFDGIRIQRPKRAANGIIVAASKDGGQTWNENVPVIEHTNSVTPFEDKPWLVTDNVEGSPYKNNLYLSWTRFDEYGKSDPSCHSHIFFSRSDDGGKTFAPPFRISDSFGDCVDSDNTLEGAVPAVGVNGEVLVVWSGPKGLYFDKSTDGGWTFRDDRVIQSTPGGWDINVAGISRHNGMPVTKVDTGKGPNRGTIYVNWIDERNGDTDVFVMSSRDAGESWSQPVRVNDDNLKNGKAQFFTWMAVDPVDGSINVVFYDRRDYEGTRTGLTLARSIDGGRTFVNHRINQEPFDCNAQAFFGDYSNVDAYGGRVVPIYQHFISPTDLAISVALFRFKPGTQEQVK
jgi:hypothetical protein